MKRFVLFPITAFFAFIVGIAVTALVLSYKSQNNEKITINEPIAVFESGLSSNQPATKNLEVPGLEHIHFKGKRTNKNSTTTIFSPINTIGDFSNCENLHWVTGWSANPKELAVREIRRFEISGKVWRYRVSANKPNVSVIFHFNYLDDDGDGTLDKCAVEHQSSPLQIPEWTRKR